ncbi:hypothetical protein HPB52_021132 [Rhipicephalus sanguineus]|uniref:Uncharacterized protein n=1 Tax=Rhipicephalus sanguineus TaxID=34632 RepID=A0A9D4SWR8_RHISA|nr:hypothetical protein HPB52_021132 [Rhipicephalus sanguineus]
MSLNSQKTFTFWSVVGGTGVTWIAGFCMNQVMVQRYCDLASIRKAQATLSSGYNALAAIIWEDFIKHMVTLSPTGAMWATKAIGMDLTKILESAAKLGMSSEEAMSLYDREEKRLRDERAERREERREEEERDKRRIEREKEFLLWKQRTLEGAAAFGLIAVVLAFLSGSLPSILTATFVTTGSIKGATSAIFILGLLFPWYGSTIALSSMFTGLVLALWVAVGRLLYPAKPTGARTTLEAIVVEVKNVKNAPAAVLNDFVNRR